jgi:hypothetical protein
MMVEKPDGEVKMSDEKKIPKKKPSTPKRSTLMTQGATPIDPMTVPGAAERGVEDTTKTEYERVESSTAEAQGAGYSPTLAASAPIDPLTEPVNAPTDAERAEMDARAAGLDVDGIEADNAAKLERIAKAVRPVLNETAEQREERLAELKAARNAANISADDLPDETVDAPAAAKAERLQMLRERAVAASGRGERATTATEETPSDMPKAATVTATGGGNGGSGASVGNGNGNGRKPLKELYGETLNSAKGFAHSGSTFMDNLSPLFTRIMEIVRVPVTKGAMDFPVRLNEEGMKLMRSEHLSALNRPNFDSMPTHIPAVMTHIMTHCGADMASLNTGVVSRFSTIIRATMIIQMMVESEMNDRDSDKPLTYPGVKPKVRDGIVCPSAMVRAFGDTGKFLAKWNFLKGKVADRSAATTRIPEPQVKEMVREAATKGRAAILPVVKNILRTAAFVARDTASLAEIDIGELDLRPNEEAFIVVIRVGDKLRLTTKMFRVADLERKIAEESAKVDEQDNDEDEAKAAE